MSNHKFQVLVLSDQNGIPHSGYTPLGPVHYDTGSGVFVHFDDWSLAATFFTVDSDTGVPVHKATKDLQHGAHEINPNSYNYGAFPFAHDMDHGLTFFADSRHRITVLSESINLNLNQMPRSG